MHSVKFVTLQQVYVDMGAVSTDSSTIALAFTGSSTTRVWEIKISQIECSNPNRFCFSANLSSLDAAAVAQFYKQIYTAS